MKEKVSDGYGGGDGVWGCVFTSRCRVCHLVFGTHAPIGSVVCVRVCLSSVLAARCLLVLSSLRLVGGS